MLKRYLKCIISLAMWLTALPVTAVTNDSEKLQNTVKAFEHQLDLYKQALDDANDLELSDEEQDELLTLDEEKIELANRKHAAAYPELTTALEELQDIKQITKYFYIIDKKDKKAIRVSAQSMIVQLAVYQTHLDNGLAELTDNPTNGLDTIETTITDAGNYLHSNNHLVHDIAEKYLSNHVSTLLENFGETLAQLDTAYDLYIEELGEDQLTIFTKQLNNVNAKYVEGLALYNHGSESDEKRDLQLFNRASKKMLRTRSWLAKIYRTIADLEKNL